MGVEPQMDREALRALLSAAKERDVQRKAKNCFGVYYNLPVKNNQGTEGEQPQGERPVSIPSTAETKNAAGGPCTPPKRGVLKSLLHAARQRAHNRCQSQRIAQLSGSKRPISEYTSAVDKRSLPPRRGVRLRSTDRQRRTQRRRERLASPCHRDQQQSLRRHTYDSSRERSPRKVRRIRESSAGRADLRRSSRPRSHECRRAMDRRISDREWSVSDVDRMPIARSVRASPTRCEESSMRSMLETNDSIVERYCRHGRVEIHGLLQNMELNHMFGWVIRRPTSSVPDGCLKVLLDSGREVTVKVVNLRLIDARHGASPRSETEDPPIRRKLLSMRSAEFAGGVEPKLLHNPDFSTEAGVPTEAELALPSPKKQTEDDDCCIVDETPPEFFPLLPQLARPTNLGGYSAVRLHTRGNQTDDMRAARLAQKRQWRRHQQQQQSQRKPTGTSKPLLITMDVEPAAVQVTSLVDGRSPTKQAHDQSPSSTRQESEEDWDKEYLQMLLDMVDGQHRLTTTACASDNIVSKDDYTLYIGDASDCPHFKENHQTPDGGGELRNDAANVEEAIDDEWLQAFLQDTHTHHHPLRGGVAAEEPDARMRMMHPSESLNTLLGEVENQPVVIDGTLHEGRLQVLLQIILDGPLRRPGEWAHVWRSLQLPLALQPAALGVLLRIGLADVECRHRSLAVPTIMAELLKHLKVKLGSVETSLRDHMCALDPKCPGWAQAQLLFARVIAQLFPRSLQFDCGWSRTGWNWDCWWACVGRILDGLEPKIAFQIHATALALMQDRVGLPLLHHDAWKELRRVEKLQDRLCSFVGDAYGVVRPSPLTPGASCTDVLN